MNHVVILIESVLNVVSYSYTTYIEDKVIETCILCEK